MSKNSTSNNTTYDKFDMNTEEIDYEKLITRLNQIKKTIILLEKSIIK